MPMACRIIAFVTATLSLGRQGFPSRVLLERKEGVLDVLDVLGRDLVVLAVVALQQLHPTLHEAHHVFELVGGAYFVQASGQQVAL